MPSKKKKFNLKKLKSKKFNLKVNGKSWLIEFVGSDKISRGSWGEADWPTTHKPKIYVYANQDEQNLVNTTIHEVLHAVRPELSEEAVTETADVLTAAIFKMGCRLQEVGEVVDDRPRKEKA
jgi:hypothetical protein